ncbi:MAG: Sarcosine oxidase subunit alpha [Alphaproteobacteria bacterium MarineAlpha5_Bin9]|nr:MAG: Sarcosine oxidase subunit alpha [Alphaproteobacteria bacterium MarineAlpha5_Bin9]|tara:strand:- start:7346 stop:10324 length:2979 start_codon:yes stop_codon:yes gene_type:complete
MSKKISFTFDGKKYFGNEKDTLASALLRNGVFLVGRSFKYHRPRGILASGSEEPNALVQLESQGFTEPNVKATEVLLYEGLKANSQNNWPSLKFDIGSVNNFLSPFFPAGFYYKTFMWPPGLWKKYEFFIRRAAGLGKSPKENDPNEYEHVHYHCDYLIVGGGVSGMLASEILRQGSNENIKILLIDQNNELGGNFNYGTEQRIYTKGIVNGDEAYSGWIQWLKNHIKKYFNLKILNSTSVFAYMHNNYLLAIQNIDPQISPQNKTLRQRIWKIRAKKVILATGSFERPLVFDNNDRPGILLANSAKQYMEKYNLKLGKKTVIFTNNDSAYQTANFMFRTGIPIECVVDLREKINPYLQKLMDIAKIPIHFGHAITDTSGWLRIKSIKINKIDGKTNKIIGKAINIDCDNLLISGGWNPNVNLFSQSRGKLIYRDLDGCFIPQESFQNEISIGACNGTFELENIFKEAYKKLEHLINPELLFNKFYCEETTYKENIKTIWQIPSSKPLGKTKMFVDFQNDVTSKDIKLALSEGYRSIEHIKRYTTTGMATDQGKTSNVNALGIISKISNRPIEELGTTTFRLPYTPITFGAIAGRNIKDFFDLERTTPIHEWHLKRGAKFEDVGQWKRPWYYPIKNENMQKAVNREVEATRNGIGILDASTLGKIDIKGRDASEFLNRVYTNAWTKLEIGKCRYGLMLGDDGMVIDDGVTSRIGKNHYVMSTTTGNAASVMSKLEDWLQTEWPDLKVFLTSVTEQFATISINGPYSEKLLNKLCPKEDFSNNNFPHMSFKEINVLGISCRIMRISFTGEKCYEINIPSNYAKNLWEICFDLGKEYNITPYGTEAMHVLRAEKGFIIVGQETDGSVTPIDLDMSWIVSKKKYDFIGKRALFRSDTIKKGRKQLVGILTTNPDIILEEGSQIVEKITKKPMDMIGHITSSYYSPNLKRSFALGLVKGGLDKKGLKMFVPMINKNIEVEITNPVFIDPSNKRLIA